ncbi:Bug family tripartite tricarboxylate transporter substrate binding protein [Bosea thiooxidans]
MFTRIKAALAAAAFGFALASPALSFGQSADSRPTTIIVPYSAGSASDILARRVAEGMAKTLNSPFIVENVVGAGGIVGTLRAQKAPADGRTLVIGTQGTLLMNKYIYKALKYDPDKDFIPVVNLVSYPNLILVPKSLNVKTLADFIALAKARTAEKRPLNYGSGGAGSSSHLGAELLKLEAGIDVVHVPYKAIADTTSDIMGGRLDVIFGSVSTFAPFVKSGDLVALAITSPARSPILPNIPTIGELGYPAAEFSAWNGLFAPAGTPGPTIDKLREAAVQATTATRQTFAAEGTDIEVNAPLRFKEYIAREGQKWEPVIRKLNIVLD